MNIERDSETYMVTKVNIDIQLPAGFPEKYVNAVKASADKCTVKKHMVKPPGFNITARIG
jgi:ribosomal protein S12 methylthiotransferase accessory factor